MTTIQGAMASTIIEKAFNTTEMLEAILLHLPEHDLLLAQRVNIKFHEVIMGSPRIREIVFFEAMPYTGTGTPSVNPLLQSRRTPSTLPLILCEHGDPLFIVETRIATLSAYASFEGFLNTGAASTDGPYDNDHEVVLSFADNLLTGTREETPRSTKCFPTGSWRKMLLTQPPCQIKVSTCGASPKRMAGVRNMGEKYG